MDEAAPTDPCRTRPSKCRRILAIAALLIWSGIGVYAAYRAWQWMAVPRGAPVIGLSLDTAWHSRLGITCKTYEVALTRVGARFEALRPGRRSAAEILDSIDALLLSGGGDIDSVLSGADPAATKLVDRARDDLEIALVRGALERDMPILGICRGIQILNVACGGTLRSLRDEPALEEVHGPALDSLSAHRVAVRGGSHLAHIVGPGERSVSSFHKQAVDRVGDALRVAATSSDGIVEGLEHPDRRFVVAVQYHPEIRSVADATALALFEELVREAEAYRNRR
jgi:gamma-glutamyl-gamma-aminobutyrate hydrolase PuuD